MTVEAAYELLYQFALVVLCGYIGVALWRSVIGPETTDRVLAVNMIGTAVNCGIAILSLLLGEGYLTDICLIYVLISFLATAILSKVYIHGKKGDDNHGR
jgi:multicomponent Na+:H+ antiporter subunit F